ncbi:MAG: hypothetical protein JW822_04155 [Spirochaetales bacterium]|nr:hypothetical protein [Spirochaetales bacterium]
MKKNFYVLFLIGLTVLLYNCVSVQFVPSAVSNTFEQRRTAEEIEVYRTKVPDKKYIEIGVVNATGSNDTIRLTEKLKAEAAENGGDALLELEPYPGGMSATVIRYIE